MEKYQLIGVFADTCKEIKNGYYINSDGEKKKFEKVSVLKSGSTFYSSTSKICDENLPKFPKTEIYTENIDTFEKAIQFGPNGACLNMASSFTPGGGVALGSKAQEESLCRRSNLLLSIAAFDQKKSPLGFNKEIVGDKHYPLPIFAGIYSPCVNIFKTRDYITFEGAPSLTNVITVSAVKHPKLDENGNIISRYVRLIKNKIRTILRIAILNKHSKLVLGAFGCGAYANPAPDVARLFKEVLEENEFIHSFEEICFAILDDHNAYRLDNRKGNYKPFVDVFGTKK